MTPPTGDTIAPNCETPSAIEEAPASADDWAELAARLGQTGRLEAALAAYEEFLRLGGTSLRHLRAARLLARQLERTDLTGRFEAALVSVAPHACVERYNLALSLLGAGDADGALVVARSALALGAPRQEVAKLFNNVAVRLAMTGRSEDAVAVLRHAILLSPETAFIHSNLLFTLCYLPGVDGQALVEEHRAFGRKFSKPFRAFDFPNDPDPARRIRLGYVSPDFRWHPVACMMKEVIRHHDRRSFEVFCYAEVERPDKITETIMHDADHWRVTVGMSDEEVAAMIRRDGIDVLVDLAGHTAKNRLPVFGLKPAPVQASWLGYPNTTGMSSMDYLLVSLPQALAVETAIPGPRPLYMPSEELPAPPPPPCLKRGHVTFGCFNNATKINAAVVDAWAEILGATPSSRLILKAAGFSPGDGNNEIVREFAARGIDPSRIELRGRSVYWEFMLETADIDIALDPFPYGGASTTFDMLHMGVPVIGLESPDPRSAVSWLLYWVGLRELVSKSRAEYVSIAVELANDPERLRGLRRALRNRLARSGFGDPQRLTTELEQIWRDLWARWANGKTRQEHASG